MNAVQPPMSDDRPELFVDTITLSNFALAGRLGLLTERFGTRLLVTSEVRDEVSDWIVAGYHELQAIETAIAEKEVNTAKALTNEERDVYRDLLRTLAPGEASCIARAVSTGGIVVTDDRMAREICGERGVACTGTIGILKACCLDGTLSPDEADVTLQAMIDRGYYSPVNTISGLL